MASSREKPDNSPVKTKDNPERQSIEAGVGGVLICVGVGSGYLGGLHDHRRVGDGFINDGVSVTWRRLDLNLFRVQLQDIGLAFDVTAA